MGFEVPVTLGGILRLAQHARVAGRELPLDEGNAAEGAGLDEFAGFAHHGVPGIAVGDGEHRGRFVSGRHELFGLLERRGHRLLAQHVDARFEERDRDLPMKLRRGDHDDGIDAVVAGNFGRQHVTPRGVPPGRINQQSRGRGVRHPRVNTHGTGDDVGEAVHPQRQEVGVSDDRIETPANNAESNAPAQAGDE